jgi:[protein-PII] uridylyltransferase
LAASGGTAPGNLPRGLPGGSLAGGPGGLLGRAAFGTRGAWLGGGAGCQARSVEVDDWLRLLFDQAGGVPSGMSLVALGSYGRRELCPSSDLDLLLLHDGQTGVDEVAVRLWYPIWDANVRLDHSVRTVPATLAVAAKDMKAALGLLDARLVAGDAELYRQLTDRARRLWEDRASTLLAELHRSVIERHARYGEVAFLLEPELKEGRGGLRDVVVLSAAITARPGLGPLPADVVEGRDTLLAIRAALHSRAGRLLDGLLLQEQDGVAADLGFSDADELMAAVAAAGRAISRHSDALWREATVLPTARSRRLRRPPRPLMAGGEIRDGEVALTDAGAAHLDATLALRLAAAAAELDAPLAPDTLAAFSTVPAPGTGGGAGGVWPAETFDAFVSLLGWGHGAIPVLEVLDQVGLLARLLPEWDRVRNRPQRNAYHRYTVDRHLLEATAQAAALARQVDRPDLLLLGALLHDIGKGMPGRDHSEYGVELSSTIVARLGLAPEDQEVVITLVRHHLLLAQAATRRDIEDPATVATVAAAAQTVSTLDLLAALTQADGLATGPMAWTAWKATLVAALVERVRGQLEGRPSAEAVEFPSADDRTLMATGQTFVRGGPTITITTPDQVGLLSRVATTLAALGLDVRAARAATVDQMAIEQFDVTPALGDWPEPGVIESRIAAAISGQLMVEDLLARRRAAYRGTPRRAAHVAPPQVLFDRSAQPGTEVVEVRCPDQAGILGVLAGVLVGLGLNVIQARAATLGHEVVDAFYVRSVDGHSLTIADRDAITEALVAAAQVSP